MTPHEHDTMRSVEDDYWWYRALRSHVVGLISVPQRPLQLLDAGCGTGGMLAWVRRRFPDAELTGLDFSEHALAITAERQTDAKLIRGSVDALPFPDESFDVVISLDVLVSAGIDDRVALREMHRVLRPHGTLIINLAAFEFLRGSHDVAVNAVRRYTRPLLTRLLRESGFNVERMTYWNTLMLPAVAVVRWVTRSSGDQKSVRSDLVPLPRPLNAVLRAIAQMELTLSKRIPLPFGTSILAVATK